MGRNKINWRVPKGMELTDLDKKVLYYQDKGCLVPKKKPYQDSRADRGYPQKWNHQYGST